MTRTKLIVSVSDKSGLNDALPEFNEALEILTNEIASSASALNHAMHVYIKSIFIKTLIVPFRVQYMF